MLYLIFIIGAIFGSFYGVVGTRLPEEKSIVKPGSHCEKCGHFLKWYENIPIVSYIVLGGEFGVYGCDRRLRHRCRHRTGRASL